VARRLAGPMEDEEAALSSCAAGRMEAGRPAGKGGGDAARRHLPRRGATRLVSSASPRARPQDPRTRASIRGGQASRSPVGRWGTAPWRGPPKSASAAPFLRW
jgi:hypothetical protein